MNYSKMVPDEKIEINMNDMSVMVGSSQQEDKAKETIADIKQADENANQQRKNTVLPPNAMRRKTVMEVMTEQIKAAVEKKKNEDSSSDMSDPSDYESDP